MFSSIASQPVEDVEALLDELVFVGAVCARIFDPFFDGLSRSLVELAILVPHMGRGDLHQPVYVARARDPRRLGDEGKGRGETKLQRPGKEGLKLHGRAEWDFFPATGKSRPGKNCCLGKVYR